MNSVGVRLEATAARPLLPSLHAAFSFGGLGGSIIGGLAATVAGPAAHLLAVAGAGLLCISALARTLVSGDGPRLPGPSRPDGSRQVRGLGDAGLQVVALGAIAGCTAYGEELSATGRPCTCPPTCTRRRCWPRPATRASRWPWPAAGLVARCCSTCWERPG